MKPTEFLSTIPFAGFYCSTHDYKIVRAFDMMFADRETGCDMAPDFIIGAAHDAVSWCDVYRAYARDYAESFLQWLGLDGRHAGLLLHRVAVGQPLRPVFESMSSPRFYNFETDRVFVLLTRADLARLWRNTDRDIFEKACRDSFTSRSGFISSYSPDWRTWGRLSSWDHNQVGTLVQAFAETEQGGAFDSLAEVDLMDSAICNGGPESWIWENAGPDLKRAVDAWDYLQDREARPVKTMAQWIAARRAENRPFDATPLGAWGAA